MMANNRSAMLSSESGLTISSRIHMREEKIQQAKQSVVAKPKSQSKKLYRPERNDEFIDSYSNAAPSSRRIDRSRDIGRFTIDRGQSTGDDFEF